MGLHSDPDWENDSFKYVNTDLAKDNIDMFVKKQILLDEDMSNILRQLLPTKSR